MQIKAKPICQCCGMPLDDSTKSKENEEYCMWCFQNGEFTYKSMDELIAYCTPIMVSQGFNEEQAREFLKSTLPTLKHWQK